MLFFFNFFYSNPLILLTSELFRSFRKFFLVFTMQLTISLNSLIKQSMARLNGNFSTFLLREKYETFKWNFLWKKIELNYNGDTVLDCRVQWSSKFGCAECITKWRTTKEKHNAFWLQLKRNEMETGLTLLFHQINTKKLNEISFQVHYSLVSHLGSYFYCKEVIFAWVTLKRNGTGRILKNLCVHICEPHHIVKNTL